MLDPASRRRLTAAPPVNDGSIPQPAAGETRLVRAISVTLNLGAVVAAASAPLVVIGGHDLAAPS